VSGIRGWITLAVVVAAVVIVVELARRLLAGRLAGRWPDAAMAARRCGRPVLATTVLISVRATVPDNAAGGVADPLVRHALWIGIIAAATWLALRIGYGLTDPPLARLDRIQSRENRRARAADAPSAWDLRCDVRERMVSYLRDKHPDALPRFRAELGSLS
jgi:hypothetical protein